MKQASSIFLLLLLALGAAGFAVFHGWLPRPWPAGAAEGAGKTAAADAADEGRLRVLGWLEPAGGLIDINGLPGDRLEMLLVAEDAVVTKGQPLARMENRALKQLQLDAARTQYQEAVARREAEIQLAETRIRTARLGIEKVKLQETEAESLREKIKLLEDNLALARKDYDRLRELKDRPRAADLSDPMVSGQELDRQQLVVHHAQSELAAAKAEYKHFQATQDLAAQAAEADLKAALASKDEAVAAVPVKSLEQKLDMARLELAMAEIKSPSDGRVMKTFLRAGETISQKPILRMANLDRMAALAEVYEVDVKQVRVGQAVTIRSKAFHAPKDKEGLRGKVVQIGRIVNTPELKSLDPFAKADRHVIPIRIEIAADDCPEAAQFVDLQVDVEMDRKGWELGVGASRNPSPSPAPSPLIMRTPLAWHNLTYNKVRTAVAAAGVAFAVVLVFMQLGFLGSVETTVTRFFDALNFDLLLRSPKYLHLSDTRVFPRLRLYQAAEVAGVQSATPVEIGLAQWRSPTTACAAQHPGHRRRARAGSLSDAGDPRQDPLVDATSSRS